MLSHKNISTLPASFLPCEKTARSIGNSPCEKLHNMLLCFEDWGKNLDLRGLSVLCTISEQSVFVPYRQTSLRTFSHVTFVTIKHIWHLFSVSFAVFSFTGCVIQSQTSEAVCDNWRSKLTWPIACAKRAQLKQPYKFLPYKAHITTAYQIGKFLEKDLQHQSFQISNY